MLVTHSIISVSPSIRRSDDCTWGLGDEMEALKPQQPLLSPLLLHSSSWVRDISRRHTLPCRCCRRYCRRCCCCCAAQTLIRHSACKGRTVGCRIDGGMLVAEIFTPPAPPAPPTPGGSSCKIWPSSVSFLLTASDGNLYLLPLFRCC